jgi:hypothetical protein
MDEAIYTLDEGPNYVRDQGPSLLTGFYSAEFVTDEGKRLTRYLTDKGRAEVLRRSEAGQRQFSQEELDELTVDPEFQAVETRFVAEAGEGA